jgi:hypothetical protein
VVPTTVTPTPTTTTETVKSEGGRLDRECWVGLGVWLGFVWSFWRLVGGVV